MIFEQLLGVVVSVIKAVFGEAVVVPEVPAWVDDGAPAVAGIISRAAALGNWVPLDLFGPLVGAVVACLACGFGIKVARIILSFVTLGGGAAG